MASNFYDTVARFINSVWDQQNGQIKTSGSGGSGTPSQVIIYDDQSLTQATVSSTTPDPEVGALIVANRDYGNMIEVAPTAITRPANITAYDPFDTIANSTTQGSVSNPIFANAARTTGKGGYIVAAYCSTSQTTFNGTIRLHLFKSAPTAIADNAAYTLLDANNASRVGHIDFSGFLTGGTGSTTAIAAGFFPTGNALPYVCSGTSLFAMIETRTAFPPASGQTFGFRLVFDRI